MSDYRRLIRAVRPHLSLLSAAIAAMVVLSGATGAFSWLVGPMFQFVFKGGSLDAGALRSALPFLRDAGSIGRGTVLRALPVLILAIALVRGTAYFVQFYCMGMLGQRVVADLRLALHEKLLQLPPAFFARSASGDLLSRFSNDIAQLEFAVTYGLAAYLRDGMQVLVLLGISIALDWRLALLAFVAVPLTVVPIVRFARRLKKIATRGQAQIGTLYTLLHEALQGVRIVQSFGMEKYEREKFSGEQDRFLATMRKSFFVRAIFTPTLEIMAAVGIAATVVFAARAVASAQLQPERVISFLATIVLLYTPLKSLGGTGQGVTQGMAGARRLWEVLDEPAEPVPGALELAALLPGSPLRGRLVPLSGAAERRRRRRAAGAARGGPDAAARRGGGAGRPLGRRQDDPADAAPRFYDPDAGRISLDGADLREATPDVAAPAQVGAGGAGADPLLQHASPRTSATAARAPPTRSRAPPRPRQRRTTSSASFRGLRHAGGRARRAALRRAEAARRDRPRPPQGRAILMLDEATSALDAESERAGARGRSTG